jgi:choice-of-anchor C domain-containing protein
MGTQWDASEGTRSIDLSGVPGPVGGRISQSVATTPGRLHRVLFDMAGNYGGLPNVKTMTVTAGGVSETFQFSAVGRSATDMRWQTRVFDFVATTSSTTLEFRSLDTTDYGPALDNVRIFGGDTDGDGILDGTDQCPGDPRPWLPTIADSTDPVNGGLPRDGGGGWASVVFKFQRGVIPSPNPLYKTCAGFKTEHLQDIAVIESTSEWDGRLEIFATHSQDDFGHLMVLATTPGVQQAPPDESHFDFLMVSRDTAGEGIWYRRLDGSTPEGTYNHPGDVALVGQTLIVAAQNWDGGPGAHGTCESELEIATPNEISASGRSFEEWMFNPIGGSWTSRSKLVGDPDAILFYDVSVPWSPHYLGKIYIASLPLHPEGKFFWGRFTTLEATRVGDHIYLRIDDGTGSKWYRSDWMSWHADDWTPMTDAEIAPILIGGRSMVEVQTAADGTNVYGLTTPDECFRYESPGATKYGGCLFFDTFETEVDLFATRSGKASMMAIDGGFGIALALQTTIRLQEVFPVATAPVTWPIEVPPPPPTPTNGSAACATPAIEVVDLVPGSGDGLITRDPVAGLEWLDLTETIGLTPEQVMDPAGPWRQAGWQLATPRQICALFEHAGIPIEDVAGPVDCATFTTTSGPVEFPAHDSPANLEGLMSKLGLTTSAASSRAFVDQTPATQPGPPPAPISSENHGALYPHWHLINSEVFDCGFDHCDHVWHQIASQLDQGSIDGSHPGWSFEHCGPDAETGWCASEGFFLEGGVPQIASLSRGLSKCVNVDPRTCLDGIITGFSDPGAGVSVCKKCGILNDPDANLCGPGGCSETTSFPDVGSFLVRTPPLDNCPHFDTLDLTDTDSDGRGDECECGDVNQDGRNTVADLVGINACIFVPNPKPANCLSFCDGNNDGRCNVSDIVAANVEIFSPGNTSTCARQPVPGP